MQQGEEDSEMQGSGDRGLGKCSRRLDNRALLAKEE